MNIVDKYFFNKSSTANIQYDYLDGLRGIAILFVILGHLGYFGMQAFPWISFFGSAKYGVFLFFTLSSFLLTLPFLRLQKKEFWDIKIWLNFGARRLFRIFPLFIIVLMISYGFAESGMFIPLSGSEFWRHLLLQQGKSIFWTIPVEFKYYLVLPLVALSLALLKRRVFFATMLFVVLLGIINYLLWNPVSSPTNTIILGPYLPIFLLGSFSAFVLEKISKQKWTESASFKIACEIGSFILILSIVILVPDIFGKIVDRRISTDYLDKSFLLFGIVWSGFIMLCHLGSGVLRKIISFKAIRFIGIISFSIYLWNPPVIFFIKQTSLDPVVKAWSVILMTIIVSTISYLVIERPFMQIRLYPSKKKTIRPLR